MKTIVLYIVVTVLVLTTFAMWHQGTFDHGLAQWGLNSTQCERNAFGTVYCGDEIRTYNLKLHPLKVSR